MESFLLGVTDCVDWERMDECVEEDFVSSSDELKSRIEEEDEEEENVEEEEEEEEN